MNRTASLLAAVSRVFRFEYVYCTCPGMFITFFLCARSPSEFAAVPVIEGLSIIALTLFAGLGMNAIIDRDIDRKYASEKRRIPEALDVLGLRTTWAIIAVQVAITVALTVHIALQFDSWFPLALLVVEAFFGYGYSLPPLRFKLRGVWWHGFSLVLSTGLLPFVLSAYTYLGGLTPALFVFIAGFALVQYGFEFSNQALDYLEDRREGLQTPAVILGVVGSVRASLIVPFSGMCTAFAGLYWMLLERWQGQPAGASAGAMHAVWALAVGAMLAGYFVPMRNAWRMYQLCRREPPEVSVPLLPRLCRYAHWQASAVAGVAAGAAVFFFATNYAWR
jgi:4-hydroxybenzoate polyprenyltransferase